MTARLMKYGKDLCNELMAMSHIEGVAKPKSIYRRLLQLDGSPFVQAPPPPVPVRWDPVGQDILGIPAIINKIMADWDYPADSMNRMSAWTLTSLLKKRMRLHDRQEADGSIDLLITGCEVSLWMGEQFHSDLHRVFPKLRIVTISANKLLGQLGQTFPIPQLNFPFHEGSFDLRNTPCLLITHSGGTFATLACSNLLKSFT